MAEPLKNAFGAPVVHRIAAALAAVHPSFAAEAFVADALHGFEALELMPRARQIAAAMGRHLPEDFAAAADILEASLGPPSAHPMNQGMAPFQHLPHSLMVAERGLPHVDRSMRALHAITQRCTAEFAVRPFLDQHPEATLAWFERWTVDPSEHVRRLVSEGSRPRLPWAPRLRAFQRDPSLALGLLERLRDDPSLYVRRSVANHLNDIGKDHPAVLIDVARRWLADAGPGSTRRWIVTHALRSAVKQADPQALSLLGHGEPARVELHSVSILPARPRIGEQVELAFSLHNPTGRTQHLLVDLRVHYVKASGRAAPKVFKLSVLDLAPGASVALRKRLSLAQMTTRQHHPGRHELEALVNGRALPLGAFTLTAG